MLFPKKLKKGDTIAIVATGSPTSPERAFQAKKFIEDYGYKAILCENTYEHYNEYMAGRAETRAQALNKMFGAPYVDGIFCIRGGYNGCSVVEKLDLELIRKNPKIFVGYSDVTNMHVFLNQRAGLVTYHGPMVAANMIDNFDDFTKEQFERAINMDDRLVLENPRDVPFKVLCEGEAEGIIAGGNLCVLTAAIGTDNQIDTCGKIVFLEEVHEIVPRTHRLLCQFEQSGLFKDAAGVILGSFTDWESPDYPNYKMEDLFRDFFGDFKIPVMYNIQNGHVFPMSTIPLGSLCKMNTKDKTIIFERS